MKKSCVAACPVEWPDDRGISGRITVESVVRCSWNECQMTVESACSYKSLESILRQGLENLPLAQTNLPLLPDDHANLRGAAYYH